MVLPLMNRGGFLPESEGQGKDVEYLRQKAQKIATKEQNIVLSGVNRM